MIVEPIAWLQLRTRSRAYRSTVVVLLVAWLVLGPAGWSGSAWGQRDLPIVGVLTFLPVSDEPRLEAILAPFHRTLGNRGWTDGENVSIQYRSAQGNPARLPASAKSLVDLDANVIFAVSAPVLSAAYAQSRTVPIVGWDYTTDPVAEGYVQSYRRPGGNVTGVFLDAPAFSGTWLQVLKEVVPGLKYVSVIWDPGPGDAHLRAVKSLAPGFNIELEVIEVRKADIIEEATVTFDRQSQAIIVLPSPMTYAHTAQLVELANEHSLPAISIFHEFAATGGLLSYGPDITAAIERNAELIAKILEGSSPAELPVERPSRIRFAVNLNTARKFGIAIPQSVLLRADKVIR